MGKRKNSIFILLLLGVALFIMAGVLSACGKKDKSDNKENGGGVTVPTVRLEALNLDDGKYTLAFDKDVFDYTVKLPDGRPPIPRVSATAAEGVSVEIFQGYIPDGETSGSARIIAKAEDGSSNIYTVTFERDRSMGFVLQYDDRYAFKLSDEARDAGRLSFESDNEESATVSRSGIIHAKKVSETPVTITARSDGKIVETLVIDRIEKAHVNLFFLTGQSNAQGCYSSSTMKDASLNQKQLANVEKIGQDGIVYSYDYYPRSSNTEVYKLRYTLYDMNTVKKQGIQNSLGKTWYELCGEKVVFLQTAYSGAPIQSWLDPKRHEEAGRYTSSLLNFYEDTKKAYSKLVPMLEENFEIIRTANFWNQGGTAMVSVYSKELSDYINSGDEGYDASKLMTDEEYYRLFMLMHEDMKEDFGIEVCGVLLNRVTSGAASAESKALQSHTDMVPIRCAQYGLHNTVPEVSIVSRVGDYAKKTTWENKNDYGYGFVDTDNTHFTQIGHNERGRVAARTAFEIWLGGASAESVEIVGQNGRDRLTSKDTVKLEKGNIYRLAGYALPMGSGEKTVLTSSDPEVATVDKYGVVTGIKEGKVVITATTESGKIESVNFEIK